MKLLIVIAAVVLATVSDLLFGNGHHVHVVLDWLQSMAGSLASWRID
ncbi:hypothetical protein [Sphingomonas sp. DT-204]